MRARKTITICSNYTFNVYFARNKRKITSYYPFSVNEYQITHDLNLFSMYIVCSVVQSWTDAEEDEEDSSE